MFLFRRQPQVQLSDESDSVCAWSLPCCVSRKYIQLPDDSDDEGGHPVRGIEEENDLLDAVDNNHFSQFNSHQMLSHNPFARSSIHHVLPTHEEQETLSLKQKNEVVVMEEAVEASEELVEISNRDPFKQYENEPDWTEIDEESDEEYNKELINTTYNNSNQCNQAEISTPLVSTDVPEMTVQEEEEEEEEVIPKNEQIPQLDEEVLHLLPLSQLSTDIPENLIHKRERSMYDDKESIFPYQSVNRMSTIFNSQSTEIMAISNTVSRDTLDSVSTNEIVTSPEMISSSSNTVEMISPKEGSSLAHTISDGLSYIKKNIIMNEDSYEAETSLKEV
ncbi:hypothetical protein BDB01DRAFT_777840 [Pilobolus umbonatus]|nr:hypothetical protein BDB01DRAFT_777840 [Pilobolus umbonatus]